MESEILRSEFQSRFGSNQPRTFFSPGRINLIGEHIDYNGGFVLPGAIDKGVMAAIAPNGGKRVKVYSMDYDESVEFGLEEKDSPSKNWACYIFGVCREMIKRGAAIGGFNVVFAGDVPLGAGLSSSAALESTFAYALNELFSCGFDKKELVLVGQKTEHNYVGVKCGIMDQFASLFGRSEHLIKLDCSTMEYEYVPFNPEGYKLVLIDSIVKHELVGSPYNRRRQSCENAVTAISTIYPEIKFLAQADPDMLEEVRENISKEDYKRAKYAIEESIRLTDTVGALKINDYERVGRNMYATHEGLSRLYEVSTPELDFLNDMAHECGVTGSRLMGGGFGGCTINLVKDSVYNMFTDQVVKRFRERFGMDPTIYPVVISDGAREIF